MIETWLLIWVVVYGDGAANSPQSWTFTGADAYGDCVKARDAMRKSTIQDDGTNRAKHYYICMKDRTP